MSEIKVLVVEDDRSMAEMLQATMSQFDVTACTEKAHAINRAKKHLQDGGTPQVVLIDLIINGEGGVDFYQWLRDNHYHMPVIFLTGCHPHSPEYLAAQETGEVVYEKDRFSSKVLADQISQLVLSEEG